MVARVEANIWDRTVESSWDDLGPAGADAILSPRFRQADLDRMNELGEIARQGSLSTEQQIELDPYARVGRMVAVLQSKARMSLRRSRGT
jgi:hypothetical protein